MTGRHGAGSTQDGSEAGRGARQRRDRRRVNRSSLQDLPPGDDGNGWKGRTPVPDPPSGFDEKALRPWALARKKLRAAIGFSTKAAQVQD